MPTKRTPVDRTRRGPRISGEVIEAFKRLRSGFEEGECTCPPRPVDADPPPRCEACQWYAQAEGEVIGLLDLRPWQDLRNPHFRNPYPKGSPAWQHREDKKKLKHDDNGGYALWWKLEAACGLERLQIDNDGD